MASQTSIINIFTYGLPFDLANQIYNEYQDRLREANYLIEISPKYSSLNQNKDTLTTLLALSIFHKRVIANLDAAVKFYGTVNSFSQAETISIGHYNFNGEEKNRLLALLINYQNLLKRFNITPALMNYNFTKEFLRNLLVLKSASDNAESEE